MMTGPRALGSDVEAEVQDVALLDTVVLAFQPQAAASRAPASPP